MHASGRSAPFTCRLLWLALPLLSNGAANKAAADGAFQGRSALSRVVRLSAVPSGLRTAMTSERRGGDPSP